MTPFSRLESVVTKELGSEAKIQDEKSLGYCNGLLRLNGYLAFGRLIFRTPETSF